MSKPSEKRRAKKKAREVAKKKVVVLPKNKGEFWWLAINGPTVAASPWSMKLRGLEVAPVPEQLVGFRTQAEQLKIQKFMLEADIDDVMAYIRGLPPRINSGEVAYSRPANPEPPVPGQQTAWVHNNTERDHSLN